MKNLETCHHCGEEKENCYHGYIAMCLPIPEAEEKIEKWNLIDAYGNYCEWVDSENTKGREDAKTLRKRGFLVKQYYILKLSQEAFINRIKTDEEFAKKWYTKTWWKGFERTDLSEEDRKEMDNLATYDQLLNTVGRGVQCNDCGKKEAELYEKYYPKNLEV